MATLFLTCGLPGAGKTTLARELERRRDALRLTADDWLRHLFGPGSREDLDAHRTGVEALQWEVALRVLELGRDVIVDWGVWTRAERDRYRSEAQAGGVSVVLLLLDPPHEVLWQRIQGRAADGGFVPTEAELRLWDTWFERPTPDELAAFDSGPHSTVDAGAEGS
jgi:predicted kinase